MEVSIVARPKSSVKRKALSTTIKIDVLEKLKRVSEVEGIPINRLIEVALEKYLDKTEINIK